MMPETCAENATVPAIEVRHLEMGYGSFILMQDISFKVEAGQVMVIMGGSGCGKSTLLKYLIGLKEVEKGEIFYQGKVSPRLRMRNENRLSAPLVCCTRLAPCGARERWQRT